MNVLKFCVCAVLACVVTFAVSTSHADPAKKPAAAKEAKKEKGKKAPKKGKRNPGAQLAAGVMKRLAKVELTDDQKAEIKKLAEAHGAKMAEARKSAGLSKEQLQARQEAMKAAKADGKKGKEAREAVAAATKLTEDQKAAMAKVGEMQKAFMAAVHEVLTDDQKAALKPARQGGKKKKKDA